MYCKHCGKELNDGNKFCPSYGMPTDNSFEIPIRPVVFPPLSGVFNCR